MRVHHVVAARMKPALGPEIICHVLLVEHPDGLTLVDTGYSRLDLRERSRLGTARHLLRPQAGATAADAVEQAGFDISDVAHLVFTHLDLDHVGGAADFPRATWHTTAEEWRAATVDTKLSERSRYRSVHFAGSPEVRTYAGVGDPWKHGLSAHEVLPGISLVPMVGHSRGHAAVAVDGDDGVIVHAGDAAFDASVYGATDATGEPLARVGVLRLFERTIAATPRRLKDNHAALASLHADPDTTVVTAHDVRVFPTP